MSDRPPEDGAINSAANFRVELATANDDAAFRRLLASNAVPGRVTVTFEREPSYFLGCGTMGRRCQVLVARHDGETVGVACRAVRPMFVNREVAEVGYLGQLRVDERFRGRWLVSRGFQYLRQLHDEAPVPAYLLSVIEQNREAFGVLIERRRKHFPAFSELGRLFTLALPLRHRNWGKANHCESGTDFGLSHRPEQTEVRSTELTEIVEFLRRHGAARQFYPAYTADDFSDGATTRGFHVEDFVTARRGGRIAGVIGLWDQSIYKQTVVRGYAGWLRASRPLYNLGAKLRGRPPLPPIGEEIRYCYASFVCVAGDDPEIFRALLEAVLARAAARGHSYLMIGFTERDPLLIPARRLPHIAYPSRLFLAAWENGGGFYERLDGRVPYVEIAAL